MIGYDLESFLFENNNLVAAERYLSGNKHEAMSLSDDVVAHPDNIMAEIAAARPFDPKQLVARIRNDVSTLIAKVSPATVQLRPSVLCTKELLASSKYAAEVGCDPDNQYGGLRPSITATKLGMERYAGGHIHFDTHRDLPADIASMVCDVTLGAAVVAFGEKQGGRRKTYGLPGLNRPKSYGVEYRTMSNFWASMLLQGGDSADGFLNRVVVTAAALEKEDEKFIRSAMMLHDYAADIITREDTGEAANLYQTVEQEIRKCM